MSEAFTFRKKYNIEAEIRSNGISASLNLCSRGNQKLIDKNFSISVINPKIINTTINLM